MPWQEGQTLPYDGYYNGRADLMIENGTYADYRPKLLERANRGKLVSSVFIGTPEEKVTASKKVIDQWDKQWEAIPVEERIRRRNVVADDVEIKEKIVYTARGPMRVFRSQPSRNNNLDPRKKQTFQKKKNRRPIGFVTKDTSPATVQIPRAVQAPQQQLKSE